MHIQENRHIAASTTFGLPCTARYYVEAHCNDDLCEALSFARTRNLEVILLGGGSNVVFAPFLDSLVIQIRTRGIDVQGHTVSVKAGENWHSLVLATLELGLFGLENLSLIPGSAGAAPIQNIGAYGVEIDSVISAVTVLDRQSLQLRTLDTSECGFGYRTSVFKEALRNKIVVTDVSLKLDSEFKPRLDYPELQAELESESKLTAKLVSDAVIRIRERKLPNPSLIGNVGSFFKNPIISSSEFEAIKLNEPEITGLVLEDRRIKLSAAKLIDQSDLKGEQIGGARVSEQHALVITNQADASFADVQKLVNLIVSRIQNRFGVLLETEPVFYS